MSVMSHKERILDLMKRGVANIYQNTVTVFERIILWDFIEKVNWVDLSQDTSQEATQRCFDSFIQDINSYIIEESNAMTKTNMECLKSKIENEFQTEPGKFVEEMADMIHKENQLIKTYYYDEVPVQDNFDRLFITRNDSEDTVMENLKTVTELLKQQLSDSYSQESQVLALKEVHGAEGQARLRSMEIQCTKIAQVCCGYFTDVFTKMEEAMGHLKNAKKIFQKKLSYDPLKLPLKEKAMSLNALEENFQIFTSALCSVRQDMKTYEEAMIRLYHQFPQAVRSELFCKFPDYQSRLETYLNGYFQMSVLTVKCPANQYFCKATPAKKKESENTKRKAKDPKASESEEKTELHSTLKILGALSFGLDLSVVPSQCSVMLVDDRVLPEMVPEGTNLHLKPENTCGKLKPAIPPKLNGCAELTFHVDEIVEIARMKNETSSKNDEKSGVCETFARLCYKIDVAVYGKLQSLHAVSHPIGLRTGSAQLLPSRGSLTWYHWNVDNVYEQFRIPQKLPATQVLDMLDMQVSNIKEEISPGSHKTKSRSLSTNERKFLKKMMLGAESTSEIISLKDFISGKPIDNKRKSPQDSTQKKRHDFYTWFYALLKSLNGFMKGLWLDCLIYEICSLDETSNILGKEETAVGTIIMRPSTVQVRQYRCLDAHLDIVLDYKTNQGSKVVDSIYWESGLIKHLPEALLTVGSVWKYILGVNNRIWPVSVLKDYYNNDETRVYRSTVFKITMSLQVNPDGNQNAPDYEEKGSVVDLKKQKTDLSRADSLSCAETSSSYQHNNQSALQPTPQRAFHEMSPSSEALASPIVPGSNLVDLQDISQVNELRSGTDMNCNPLWNSEIVSLIPDGPDIGELSAMSPTVFLSQTELETFDFFLDT